MFILFACEQPIGRGNRNMKSWPQRWDFPGSMVVPFYTQSAFGTRIHDEQEDRYVCSVTSFPNGGYPRFYYTADHKPLYTNLRSKLPFAEFTEGQIYEEGSRRLYSADASYLFRGTVP